MNKRLALLILLLAGSLLAWEFKTTPVQEEGAAAIKKACETSFNATFSVERTLGRFDLLPGVEKAVHYRHISDDGIVLRRMEFYDKQGKHRFTFIQNEDGQFAVDEASGKTARGDVFMPLFILEPLYIAPYSLELKYSDFTTRETRFDSRPCTKITVSIPGEIRDEMPYLIALCGFVPTDIATFQKYHSFTREYIVDKETGIVLDVKRYNYHGRLVFKSNLAHFNPAPDLEKKKLFDTPQRIDFQVADTRQFLEALSTDAATTATGHSPSFLRMAWYSLLHWRGWKVFFGIAAALFLGTAIFLKIRSKR